MAEVQLQLGQAGIGACLLLCTFLALTLYVLSTAVTEGNMGGLEQELALLMTSPSS